MSRSWNLSLLHFIEFLFPVRRRIATCLLWSFSICQQILFVFVKTNWRSKDRTSLSTWEPRLLQTMDYLSRKFLSTVWKETILHKFTSFVMSLSALCGVLPSTLSYPVFLLSGWDVAANLENQQVQKKQYRDHLVGQLTIVQNNNNLENQLVQKKNNTEII